MIEETYCSVFNGTSPIVRPREQAHVSLKVFFVALRAPKARAKEFLGIFKYHDETLYVFERKFNTTPILRLANVHLPKAQ